MFDDGSLMWDSQSICSWRDDTVAAATHTRKRRAMSEMDGNVQRTPIRRRKQDAAANDETPRQQRQAIDPPIHFPPQEAPPTMEDNASSMSSSLFSSDSQAAKKRKRSVSPPKQMDERQYAKWAIEQRTVEDLRRDVNPLISEAVRLIKMRIGKGKGIIHSRYATDKLRDRLRTGDDEADNDIFQGAPDWFGAPPPLAKMERIKQRAATCFSTAAGEGSWNSGVHDFLLEESMLVSGMAGDLTWENITSAAITPSLVPELIDAVRVDSRKVDFCVALALPNHRGLGKIAYRQGITTFNQTEYGPIRYKPISVSIETKPAGDGGLKALVQLETWAAAQIQKLQQLSPSAGNVQIPLPLIVTQGHIWFLYYLQQNSDGTSGTLWSCCQLGSTSTLLGCYQVVAGLQVLMRWSVETYQPWFEEKILRGILDPHSEGAQAS